MDWIQPLLTGLVIGIFLWYSNNKSTEKVEKNQDGKYHLKMNSLYKWTGFFSVLIAIGVIILSIIFYEEGIFMWVAFIVLMFGGLGVPILMYYYNHELVFDETSISIKNWKGKVSNINWDEIESVKFKPMWGYLNIKTKSENLNIHQHLIGLIEFLKVMEVNTTFKAEELKLPFKIK